MAPEQRRDLGEKRIGDRGSLDVDEADGAAEIDGVPQDDRVDDKVEARGAVGHRFGDAVAQFSELMDEDGARQRMAASALVEDGVGSPKQLGIEEPVADEDRTFDPADLAQRDRLPVLARGGGDLLEDHRRR